MTVALVLGAAVRPDGTPSPTLRLRVEHAVGLYHAGQVQALCIAGGQGRYGPPEATVGCALAQDLGVPAEDLIAEDRSRSTFENLIFARPLLRDRPLVIVSNRWHLPRAALVARILKMPARTSGPRGQMPWPGTLRAVLREALLMPRTALRAVRWVRRNGP
ncbi:MAG: YdcF family protein [Jannaschia sp.]